VAEVARVTSLGVLTASIAHEVNQPIAAARNNAASDSRDLGHMDVSDQAGGLVETARCEKIGRRWESFGGVTQRSHEPSQGLAKEFIILDDRDQWRFGQSALLHRARPSLFGRFNVVARACEVP